MTTRTDIFRAILFTATGALLLTDCKDRSRTSAQNDVIFKNLDTSVKPGEDFFRYANGSWLKKNPIPAAYP
ncbi:MAG: hypothetical protein M3N14_00990, partial [Bacteroidota bacterium]|nr:hypothetical protein [Bacteroidota bacterium]